MVILTEMKTYYFKNKELKKYELKEIYYYQFIITCNINNFGVTFKHNIFKYCSHSRNHNHPSPQAI